MIGRMIRAAMLQVSVYEEVESDKSATLQALVVIVLVALASGVGLWREAGVPGLVVGVAVGIVGWALWAGLTYLFGTTLFKTPETHADWGQLARTIGFAQSPGVLKVLGFLPVVGGFVFFAVFVWQLAAVVIAIRQALDYTSTVRALAVAVVAGIPYVIVMAVAWAVAVAVLGVEAPQ